MQAGCTNPKGGQGNLPLSFMNLTDNLAVTAGRIRQAESRPAVDGYQEFKAFLSMDWVLLKVFPDSQGWESAPVWDQVLLHRAFSRCFLVPGLYLPPSYLPHCSW